ncbi:hypothetical protein J437_LFUL011411 [Ladona fulva]|uniref:Rab3 GTPase-activating protein catalytic subunit n=1 Tax=Ladona fulva TaxID=123851 RepID=A0A8K0KCL6_LADFU|nr:hypothetical protein J437_LFUL011411 [Ladona fulva]
MNEETEDAYVHHDDFTLSSEWEKFIDKLEKIIFKWKLHEIKPGPYLKKEDYVNGFWEVITESVEFADFKFDFRKYCLKPRKDENDQCTPVSPVSDEDESSEDFVRTFETLLDLNSSENCFIPPVEVGTPDMYCIVRWYGLREFLVLSPQPRHSISSESRLKILLSSVLIAVNNCSCPVPVFVQFHHPSNHYFVGVSEGSSGIRVDFEMTHLNSPPPGSHLSGLLDMFKYKIRDPSALIGRIKVSAQFTYKIRNQTYIRSPAMESNLGECPFDTHLFFLPFKTHLNSWEIHLMATWPLLPEDAVVDRVGSSSFHPLSAPLWSIRMPFLSFPHPVLQPGRAISNLEKWEYPLLAQYLLNCISCTRTSGAHINVLDTPVIKLIGGAEQDYDDLGLPPKAALDILTNSKVADITKVVNKATKSRLQKIWQGGNASQGAGSNQTKKPEIVEEGPIADDKLLPILHFLFPDADENHKYSYPSGLTEGAIDEKETTLMKKKKTKFKRGCPWLGKRLKVGALLRNVQDPKTCPADSLTWRMALALAYVYQKFGGAMAAAHLWYEVTQEARYRWDKLIPLPG